MVKSRLNYLIVLLVLYVNSRPNQFINVQTPGVFQCTRNKILSCVSTSISLIIINAHFKHGKTLFFQQNNLFLRKHALWAWSRMVGQRLQQLGWWAVDALNELLFYNWFRQTNSKCVCVREHQVLMKKNRHLSIAAQWPATLNELFIYFFTSQFTHHQWCYPR